MSGSTRAITLSLKVQDADQVLTTLRSIGPAGEQALARLEAAATKATGRAGGGGGTGFVGLRTAVQQGGFQLQDFFVQVQGGTSALTALAQQGSQFLGIFGPAGAIAGAALAIGAVALKFLDIGTAAEDARKKGVEAFAAMATEGTRLQGVLREVDTLFRTAAENAAASTNARVTQMRTDAMAASTLAVTQQESLVVELSRAQAALDAREALLTRRNQEGRGPRPGSAAFNSGLVDETRRVADLQAQMTRAANNAAAASQILSRLQNAGVVGVEQYGPPNPDTPASRAAARRGAAAAARDARTNAALSQADFASDVRAESSAMRDYDAALRSIETPMERYTRRVEELTELQDRLVSVGQDIAPADYNRLISSYEKELADATNRTSGLNNAARELGMTFSSAFEDAIINGKKLSDVLQGVAQDLARIILRQAVVQPLAGAASSAATAAGNFIGSLFGPSTAGASVSTGGSVASALGNAFSNGRLIPFATGGVVDRATVMPMALMGEAGPEAVMPLDRDSRGRLGVRSKGGGGGVVNHFNIDARGADPSVVPLIQAGIQQAVRQSKAELLGEIQRGGQAAKIVGRRR